MLVLGYFSEKIGKVGNQKGHSGKDDRQIARTEGVVSQNFTVNLSDTSIDEKELLYNLVKLMFTLKMTQLSVVLKLPHTNNNILKSFHLGMLLDLQITTIQYKAENGDVQFWKIK